MNQVSEFVFILAFAFEDQSFLSFWDFLSWIFVPRTTHKFVLVDALFYIFLYYQHFCCYYRRLQIPESLQILLPIAMTLHIFVLVLPQILGLTQSDEMPEVQPISTDARQLWQIGSRVQSFVQVPTSILTQKTSQAMVTKEISWNLCIRAEAVGTYRLNRHTAKGMVVNCGQFGSICMNKSPFALHLMKTLRTTRCSRLLIMYWFLRFCRKVQKMNCLTLRRVIISDSPNLKPKNRKGECLEDDPQVHFANEGHLLEISSRPTFQDRG